MTSFDQGKRFTQLQCKRYDIDTAKKELNEDVCVEHKRLNHFIHQRESRIRRLSELCLKVTSGLSVVRAKLMFG